MNTILKILFFLLFFIINVYSSSITLLEDLGQQIDGQRENSPFSKKHIDLSDRSATLLDGRATHISQKKANAKERAIMCQSIMRHAILGHAKGKIFFDIYQSCSNQQDKEHYHRHLMTMAHVYYFSIFCMDALENDAHLSVRRFFNTFKWENYQIFAKRRFYSTQKAQQQIFINYLSERSMELFLRSEALRLSFIKVSDKKYKDVTHNVAQGKGIPSRDQGLGPALVDYALSTLAKSYYQKSPSVFKAHLFNLDASLETSPFEERLKTKKNLIKFGPIEPLPLGKNAVYLADQQKKIKQADEELQKIFSTHKNGLNPCFSLEQVETLLQDYLDKSFQQPFNVDLLTRTLSIIRKFRHLKGLTSHSNAPHCLGDVVGSLFLSRFMDYLREETPGDKATETVLQQRASPIGQTYYEMAQVVGHLLDNTSQRLTEGGWFYIPNEYWYNTYETKRLAPFDFQKLAYNKMVLLIKAVKIDPTNLQAKYRLLEMLFADPYLLKVDRHGNSTPASLQKHLNHREISYLHHLEIPLLHQEAIRGLLAEYQQESGTALALPSKKPLFIKHLTSKLQTAVKAT